MKDQWAFGLQAKVIGKGLAPRGQSHVVEGRSCHLPIVNPCREWFHGHTRLPDPAACDAFGHKMPVGCGDGSVGEPDLRIRPALACFGRQGRPEQRPLNAIGGAVGPGEVGGQIPPFDPVVGMRAMVLREIEHRVGCRNGKAISIGAQPGKSLRGHLNRQPQDQEKRPSDHWRTP